MFVFRTNLSFAAMFAGVDVRLKVEHLLSELIGGQEFG